MSEQRREADEIIGALYAMKERHNMDGELLRGFNLAIHVAESARYTIDHT